MCMKKGSKMRSAGQGPPGTLTVEILSPRSPQGELKRALCWERVGPEVALIVLLWGLFFWTFEAPFFKVVLVPTLSRQGAVWQE